VLAADCRPVEAEDDVAGEDVVEDVHKDVAEDDHKDVAEDDHKDVAEDDQEGQPLVVEGRPLTEPEALRRLRDILNEGDSSLPFEDQVRKIQLRREVKDFLMAALQQQPPTPAPTDTEAEAAADTGADEDGRE
jgi:hypothetical protein